MLHKAVTEKDRAEIMGKIEKDMKQAREDGLRQWKEAMHESVRTHSRYYWNWLRGPRKIPAHQMKDDDERAVGPLQCLKLLQKAWCVIFTK